MISKCQSRNLKLIGAVNQSLIGLTVTSGSEVSLVK